MTSTVAVVIPTYNRLPVLPRAIESVLAQSRPADEVIVVDDGSTDATASLQKIYPEITYISQTNQGVSAARNKGIARATSRWIAFLDSDDEWLPEKLSTQLQLCEQQPECPLVHSDEIWIRKGVRVNQMAKHAKSGGDIFERCLPLCSISPSAAMVRRELLLELGGFNESLPACEDYDLWLRICASHDVLFVEEPLLKKYGGHADQLSSLHWGMDRFRVRALHELLESGVLDRQQARSAKAVLLEKCDILQQGARKRENHVLLAELDELRQHYE